MAEKKSVVKKSISLREDVYSTAESMADKFFGGNFSAYLTYLICADKHGLSRARTSVEETAAREEIKEVVKNTNVFQKSDEAEDYINDILST